MPNMVFHMHSSATSNFIFLTSVVSLINNYKALKGQEIYIPNLPTPPSQISSGWSKTILYKIVQSHWMT
jgi:hypothetical protein